MKHSVMTYVFVAFLVVIGAFNASSQETQSAPMVVETLFEYPSAPEEMQDWTERNNWLVENFWKPFDFKQKSVGQFQLDHAFKTWTYPMRFANKEVVNKSVDKLIATLAKHPTLLYQFTRSAENNIYGSQAEVWIDEVYVKFLNALIKCKKISDIRKVRYQSQLNSLQNSLVGSKAQKFDFIDRGGKSITFSPEAKYTIIEFGHSDCSDCQIARIHLETNQKLQQLSKDNQVLVYFIIPDFDNENWVQQVSDYPHHWTVGASDSVEEVYDIRLSPTFYLIGPDRNILLKNVTADEVVNTVIQLLEQ